MPGLPVVGAGRAVPGFSGDWGSAPPSGRCEAPLCRSPARAGKAGVCIAARPAHSAAGFPLQTRSRQRAPARWEKNCEAGNRQAAARDLLHCAEQLLQGQRHVGVAVAQAGTVGIIQYQGMTHLPGVRLHIPHPQLRSVAVQQGQVGRAEGRQQPGPAVAGGRQPAVDPIGAVGREGDRLPVLLGGQDPMVVSVDGAVGQRDQIFLKEHPVNRPPQRRDQQDRQQDAGCP